MSRGDGVGIGQNPKHNGFRNPTAAAGERDCGHFVSSDGIEWLAVGSVVRHPCTARGGGVDKGGLTPNCSVMIKLTIKSTKL